MRNNSWSDGWLQSLGASQAQPDDWWQKWRQEAGQYGLLNAPEQPAQPAPPVDTPDPATGTPSDNPFGWIENGIPWNDERFRDLDGAGRFFAPLMFGVLNWMSDSDFLDKLQTGGGSSTSSDWWQKWRDERGHKGLL